MSTIPPNMPPNTPPGGGAPPPYPPYDPKTQWRVYREQQKAAWRAQREAWKAQRQAQHYAWKAGCVSAYGPRVPSVVGPIILIAVGVVALMLMTGHINSGQFWTGFIKRPGRIVIEFLPPIPAGLKRAEFMRELQSRIEAKTADLVVEGNALLARHG